MEFIASTHCPQIRTLYFKCPLINPNKLLKLPKESVEIRSANTTDED